MRPETRYAKVDGVHIAHQVLGDGPRSLVLVPGWLSHAEHVWELPALARFLRRLAGFSRLIIFDKRGTGLSDRVSPSELPTLDQRMSDVEAVIDAAGCERAVLMGVSEGGCMSVRMAASRPDRVQGLIVYGGYARFLHSPDHSWRPTRKEFDRVCETYERKWGTPIGLNTFAPSAAGDEGFRRWWAEALRVSASPGASVEEFVTGSRSSREPERALRTVLFTDIAGSTSIAAGLGDQRWRDLLEAHQARVRRELARFGGHEVKTTGDGFVATFAVPAAAIECARAICGVAPELGAEVRAGVHTGECELIGEDVGGIAVHIAARVMSKAGAGEVLVSGTVRDLVVGSGLAFEPRGVHELKGVPGEWGVYALAGSGG